MIKQLALDFLGLAGIAAILFMILCILAAF